VKRLERDELIERRIDSADNRVVLASLLKRGGEMLSPATAAVNQVFTSLGLEDDTLDLLVRLINPIRAGAGDHVD
jgi:DNA-binding MarR family transcriptional regulator